MTTKVTVFTVSGTLPFPLDMLRYDNAWPHTESDAMRIGEACDSRFRQARFKDDKQYRWTVTLTTHAGDPTIGRWRSFGWEVDEVQPSYNL